MKHLNSFEQIFESSRYNKNISGTALFESLYKTFITSKETVINIAKSHNFRMIYEMHAKNGNILNTVLIFDSTNNSKFALEKNPEFRKQYNDFVQEIRDLRPLVEPLSNKRFLCGVEYENFDIKEWEISPELRAANDKTGLMESNATSTFRAEISHKFPSVQIWLDWA